MAHGTWQNHWLYEYIKYTIELMAMCFAMRLDFLVVVMSYIFVFVAQLHSINNMSAYNLKTAKNEIQAIKFTIYNGV